VLQRALCLGAAHNAVQVLTIGEFRFGLCHGHQVVPWGDLDSLAMLSRQLDVDGEQRPLLLSQCHGRCHRILRAHSAECAVLITGHTHEVRPRRLRQRGPSLRRLLGSSRRTSTKTGYSSTLARLLAPTRRCVRLRAPRLC
jgi:hypothetical protein